MAPRLEEFEVRPNESITSNENTTTTTTRQRNAAATPLIRREETAKKEPQEIDLPIVWRNVVVFALLHLGALYGIYLCFYAKWQTLLFAYVLYFCGGLGITAGAHRLWAHRTYKAKMPLRILLAIFQTLAVQNSIFEWSRDHRVHHKHSETNADPHNAKRGFFFSHMGWLLMKKHPEVIEKGARIPLDDLLADPVVAFQKKYYRLLAILICFVMPTVVPWLCWSEDLTIAYFVPGVFRYIFLLHITWLVNSVAHMWGNRPYDKTINPAENLFVSLGAIGEGFHNYHHTFPMDYAASEFGAKYFNPSRAFIDFMCFIGQAYDRRTVSREMIMQRRMRTGDLAGHSHNHDSNEEREYDY